MSRYNSICVTIELMESIRKSLKVNGDDTRKTDEIIHDLQDIAKDVRYGGKWEGDYEVICKSLEYCKEIGTNCASCSYHKAPKCTAILKTDAAAVIRNLNKELQKKEGLM